MEKEVFAVTDVYEHAAAIGKDIERIVLEYGKESIEGKKKYFLHIAYFLRLLQTLSAISILRVAFNTNDSEKIAKLILKHNFLLFKILSGINFPKYNAI